MTNDPYVVACLTLNGPNYHGELHTTPYMGMEPVNVLTNEAMRMLELERPAVEFIADAICRIGDCTLEADMIRYKVKFAEIKQIWDK